MPSIVSNLRGSASLKVLVIGLLVLVLLIPLSMIMGVIEERDDISNSAWRDIQQTWGRDQLIGGPVLVVPFDLVRLDDFGNRVEQRSHAVFLPETLNIESSVDAELRYRGIYEIPVYSADVELRGNFAPPDVSALGGDNAVVHWDEAFVAVGVSDARAIATIPTIDVNGSVTRFEPGGQLVSGLPAQIVAPLPGLTEGTAVENLAFETRLTVKGSGSLQFLPLGDTTEVRMRSPWASPSFFGNYLPEARTVTDAGFEAEWRVSSIGRPMPDRWVAGSGVAGAAKSSAFGVELYMPISVYRLTLRATKYGVLFIGLTFVSFFAFEVLAGLRLHPLQYVLVGLANVLFYLLLISFAEHIGFGPSFLLSCIASAGLIIGYSRSVLGSRNGAGVIAVVLAVLYSFLYMTLRAETYALVAGSIGLWITLGAIMYLTRRIDWHGAMAR